MPQALSHYVAQDANKEVISDFLGKLRAIYCKLNLLSKPMQIYNSGETGVTILHKPGKVIAALGRYHVYSITPAEKKPYCSFMCVSFWLCVATMHYLSTYTTKHSHR